MSKRVKNRKGALGAGRHNKQYIEEGRRRRDNEKQDMATGTRRLKPAPTPYREYTRREVIR